MATPRICSVADCGKRVHAHGMCAVHYNRYLRHGDPLAGRTPDGELNRYLRDVVFAYDGNECLAWPYSKDRHGYGVIKNKEHWGMVHRIVCEHLNGTPPTPEHEATHTCGRGHTGCVTGRHLVWKTHAENMDDKYAHGTVARGELNGHAKLSEAKVREIMAMKGIKTQKEIAAMYGVSPSQITRVMNRERWGHVLA